MILYSNVYQRATSKQGGFLFLLLFSIKRYKRIRISYVQHASKFDDSKKQLA